MKLVARSVRLHDVLPEPSFKKQYFTENHIFNNQHKICSLKVGSNAVRSTMVWPKYNLAMF